MWHPPVLLEGGWRQGPNIEYFYRKGKPAFCENGLIQVSPEKRNP
jgi:hypothetical protein